MKYLLLFVLMVIGISAFSQKYVLEGQVVDSINRSPLPNAVVNIKGNSFSSTTLTDDNGYFKFNGFTKGTYIIEADFLGYKKYVVEKLVDKEKTDIGPIFLSQEDLKLNEVNVIGYVTPVIQKGDTTEMSSKSYKVNADADALDLVKKMPGITVENGTVKAHGEDIKKVMIDGKDYFGNDAALSLQNLSSDMIDKVQVYNKLSDQSQFIGFDDGQGEKVMNIITKSDKRIGQNGKFSGGFGTLLPDSFNTFDGVYQLSGRWNYSNKKGNLTLTGGSNNVNQQNSSSMDMFRGGGGGPRGGDFFGKMGGNNTIHSFGANYSGNLSPKLKVSASYYFNQTINNTISHSDIELFGDINPLSQARYQVTDNISDKNNSNHRFNLNIEYTIDSMNSIIYRQNLTLQQTDQNSLNQSTKYNVPESPMIQTLSENINNSTGYNLYGNFTFRHKFIKTGRTFSVGLQFSGNNQKSDYNSISNSQYFSITKSIDQTSNSKTRSGSYSANLAYTEPINNNFLFMISYNAGNSPNNYEKFVFDNRLNPPTRMDSLSNERESNYFTQRGGLSLMILKGKDLSASVGVEYQDAVLSGDQSFPELTNTSRNFRNFLPNLVLNYKISKASSIRTVYRTSTSAPSISQLQPIIDISNPSYFSLGNPNLNPSYSHMFFSNFRYANTMKFTNFGFNVFGNYMVDPIGSNIQIMEKDSTIYGQVLSPNGQLVNLQNMPDSWMVRGFMNYGFLFKPIKCNLNFMTGAGYTTSQGIFNQELSTTRTSDFNGGVVIASNISQYIDFTISYNTNYSISENSVKEDLNSNTWRHTIGLTSTFSTKKGLVFTNSLSEQILRGLGQDYNNDYLIWNISLGQKIFKNKSGQISIQLNDALDQNKDISRSITDYYVSDNRSNTIGRYCLLTFTYTLRAFSPKGDRPDFRFGPHGGPPMGPPMGPPPGGGF